MNSRKNDLKQFPFPQYVLEGGLELWMREDIDHFIGTMQHVHERIMRIVDDDLIGSEQDKKEIHRLLRGMKHFTRQMMVELIKRPQYIRAHTVPAPDGN